MSTNFIESETPPTEEKKERQNIKDIYIGVFFDGTSNNMHFESSNHRGGQIFSFANIGLSPKNENAFSTLNNLLQGLGRNPKSKKKINEYDTEEQKEIDQLTAVRNDFKVILRSKPSKSNELCDTKLSNVAFLTSLYQGTPSKNRGNSRVYNIYIEGSGAKVFNDTFSLNRNGETDGLAFGVGKTGVVAYVAKSLRLVTNYLDSLALENKQDINIHFDVFGFSRGSTCARLFAYLVARGKEAPPLPREAEFQAYLGRQLFTSKVSFLEDYNEAKVKVDFLGIYDTVASIGFLTLNEKDEFHNAFVPLTGTNTIVNALYYLNIADAEKKGNYHRDNVKNYGLYSPSLKRVENTLHIGALDEFRENFALTDIGLDVPEGAVEILMPGGHSDIGGGHLEGDVNHVTLFQTKGKSKDAQQSDGSSICVRLPWDTGSPKVSPVGEASLRNLGWIWDKEQENKVLKNMNQSHEYKSEGEHYIDFWSNPRYGYKYSNIPLHMMMIWAHEQTGRNMFVFDEKENKKIHPRMGIPEPLDNYYNSVIANLHACEKCHRYSFQPGDYNSQYYRWLRSEYLHFTASDLWNFTQSHASKEDKKEDLPKNLDEWDTHYYTPRTEKERNKEERLKKTNKGNILGANAPYRKDHVIRRLVYDGGENGDNRMYTYDDLTNTRRVNIDCK